MTGDQQPTDLSPNQSQYNNAIFALQAAEVGTWDLDIINRRVWWDERCKELYGFDRDDIIPYEQVLSYMQPDDRSRVDAAVHWALDPQSQGRYDIQFRTIGATDGQLRWLHCRGRAFFDDQQVAYRFSGIAQDITELVDVRQQLGSSEARFADLVATTPAATAVFIGRDMLIQQVNTPMLAIWGKDESVMGKTLHVAMPELVGQPFLAQLQHVFDTGEPFRHAEGVAEVLEQGQPKRVWFNHEYKPLYSQDGQIYGVINTAFDVTAQVMARQQLEESELFTRTLFEQSPIAKAVFVGQEMRIRTANKKMLSMWGKESSVIGRPFMEALPELIGTPQVDRLRQVLTTGERFYQAEEKFELLRYGQPYTGYYEYTYEALRTASGMIYGVICVANEVTTQAQARLELAEQKTYLQNALSIADLGTFYVDVSTDMATFSENVRRWFGLAQTTEAFESVLRKIHPQDLGRVQEIIGAAQHAEDRSQHDFVYRVINPAEGGEVYLRSFGKAQYKDGRAESIIGVLQNVTEQVTAHQKLEESEARFRSIVQQSPAATLVLRGNDLVIDQINQPMLSFMGRGPEVIGHPLVAAVPELDGQDILQQARRVYTEGVDFNGYEVLIPHARTGIRQDYYYDLSYRPLIEGGQRTGMIQVVTDVTARVLARQQLAAVEARLRTIITHLPSATVVFRGRELVVETPSQNFIDIIGRGPNVEGKPLGELMPELESQSFLAILDNMFTTGQSFRAFGTPVVIQQADGSTTNDYFDLIYTPLFDSEDQVYAILSVATNVTDIMATHTLLEESETRYRLLSAQLEQQVKERTAELLATNEELTASNEGYAAINEELEESNSLLVRSNENLQTFAYVASHDLQEPLRKIQQFGDLLKTRLADSIGSEVAYLERMQVAASRMSILIRDLLAFSRISTRRNTEELVSLTDVVGNVVSVLDLVIAETNAQVIVDPLPTVSGDAVQLGQLFQNLLSNALKFRQPATMPIIRIRSQLVAANQLPSAVRPTRQTDTYHLIQIADNGIGFDEKYLDRIFQVFQRLHGKSQYVGTGVGLAICEKVVTNHGGVITANSQPGRGSTFSVYLPV